MSLYWARIGEATASSMPGSVIPTGVESDLKRLPTKALVLAVCAACALVSCRPKDMVPPPEQAAGAVTPTIEVSTGPASGYVYRVPQQTNDGWQTASLAEVGLSERILGGLVGQILDGRYKNVHSILVVKGGKLVFEEYFGGYDFDPEGEQFRGERIEFGMDTLHDLASVTKAYTSALVGIAIDHGFIRGVDERVFPFFPQYAHLRDERKDRITLEHLLTMTSGLQWDELLFPVAGCSERSDTTRLFLERDPIEYILAKPMVAEPGLRWCYSGGDVTLLGEVIQKATGLRMDDFATEYLFTPLGITEYEWVFVGPDVVYASGSLQLRPRDMAKLGYLYLNGGVWRGRRIISEEWILASTRAHASVTPARVAEEYGDRYGYQWWLRTDRTDSSSFESFLRTGWAGQRISVYPALDMVIVFTGGSYATPEPVNEIITRYILSAAE